MTDIFPDLEKRPPKQRELFSDKDINSNKILEIDYEDLSDPIKVRQFNNAIIRNQHYNKKKE
tara:strand:- start:28 stop:213 length:186 start_codon:yes stop_codon:yes gene_type:complete